jgi:ATP-dependent exoDNAse (exonuclease V) alpha subunit
MDLHTEQLAALDELLECSQPVFITGSAGTGKSFLLREAHRRLGEQGSVALAAPTGIAALNIGGMTLHSLFGLSTDGVLLGNRFRRQGSEYFQSLNALLIDEVSMVRVDVMDNVDRALRYHRDSDEPFGGVKLVLFGDPFQLPPVLREEDYKTKYDPWGWKWRNAFTEKYFFLAPGLLRTGIRTLELSHIHRQGADLEFAEILNRIRNDRVKPEDFMYLNANSRQEPPTGDTLRLFGRNEEVDAYNASKLIELPEKSEAFHAHWIKNRECEGVPLRSSATPENSVVEPELKLKPGARVMFIKNDDQSGTEIRRWVNGTLARVITCRPDGITVELESGEVLKVGRSLFDVRELVQEVNPGGKTKVYGAITGWFQQFPLKLAWAVSVHKSQGQTLERVVLDFNDQYFEAGQAYVALSRARRLGDIYFENQFSPDALKPLNGHVKRFMENSERYPFSSRKTLDKLWQEWSGALDDWCEENKVPIEDFEASKSKFVENSTQFKTETDLNFFLLKKYQQGSASFHKCLELIHDLDGN